MKTIIRGGILLGILVTIWTYLFGLTGMHRMAAGSLIFAIVATLIELAVLAWALKRTAAEGRRWFGQVSAGTLLAFVGGCLILATSYIYVTQVNPNMTAEVREAAVSALRSQGLDDAAIQQSLAARAKGETPMAQALMGFFMTVFTGFVLSAVLASFIRSKAPRATAAVPA